MTRIRQATSKVGSICLSNVPRLISSTLGYQPTIWRDQRSLTGDALLRAAIERHLQLIVVDPDRFTTLRAVRLVPARVEAFSKNPPLPNAPAHRSRIFKVIKTPLLFHLAKKEPEALRELIGHAFYEMEGDMPVEFSPDVVPAKDPTILDHAPARLGHLDFARSGKGIR